MSIQQININDIFPNPEQPRKHFNEEALQELAESIKADGLQSPILVRPSDGKYEIVQGERRYRAHILAGLETIRADVKELADEDAFHLSVIENIQREQLTAVEEAQAYQRYVNLGYTHEQIAEKVNKSRTYITTKLRLLKLIPELLDWVATRRIYEGHAKAILTIENNICRLVGVDKYHNPEETPFEFFQRAFYMAFEEKEKISVKDVEQWVSNQRHNLLSALIYKFRGQGARILPGDYRGTANDIVKLYNLEIGKVRKEDTDFLLEQALKHMKAGERRSDIYRHFEDLEDQLFKNALPEFPQEIASKEIRDYYNRLLAAVNAMLGHALHVADLTGMKINEDDPEQLADVLIANFRGEGDNQVLDDRELLIDLIREIREKGVPKYAISETERLLANVSRDTLTEK